jgi:GntR family transcriptional repressor for pyruvate dehydrogenase complex
MSIQRRYLSDVVFERLGAEILRGEIPPGTALPPEQALSERFGVSKILVRQGLHRLAEADLVSVSQGEKTRAKDPSRSSRVEVLALYYRLAPELPLSSDLVRSVLEKQYTQGLSMVELFSWRASAESKKGLVALVRSHASTAQTEESIAALERTFWSFLAEATGNCILAAEVRYWYEALASRPRMPNPAPPALRFHFYEELARRLAADKDALSYYMAELAPLMRALGQATTTTRKSKGAARASEHRS